MSRFHRAVIALLLLLASSPVVAAQCPDGTPPPCGRRPVAVAARPAIPLDSNRVAVIPFRVTTADSLLGEGLAELLASEFTGEGSPRAVDMSTMLSAWRRAGGALRTPIAQDVARQLARDNGAGLLCEGSVIGLGSRVTISAAFVNAKDGAARGQPARVTGSADSIDVLLNQVANSLLGSRATVQRAKDAGRLTKSPAAFRAYLEGLALWRRGRWVDAAGAFERSVGLDSSFVQAIYQRWLLGYAGTMPAPKGFPTIASVRDRLGPREHIVLDGFLGTGARRTTAEGLRDRRVAAERLGDSPDAWFLYGDYAYHFGLNALPPDSILAVSRAAFSKAVALDSQPVFLAHLFEVVLYQRDTAAVRQLVKTFESIPAEWSSRWIGAAFLGDAVLLDRARRAASSPESGVNADIFQLAGSVPVPLQLFDEGVRRMTEVLPAAVRDGFRAEIQWIVRGRRGQPMAADRFIEGHAIPVFQITPISFSVTGDAATDAALLKRYPETSAHTSVEVTQRACADTLVLLAQGSGGTPKDSPPLTGTLTRCGRLIRIWRASLAGPPSDSLIASLDTAAHTDYFNLFLGYEHRLLAHLYEARGDYKGAFAAIRLYPRDVPGPWSQSTTREEGRLAVLAGDTASAIRAYRRFVELYAEAEPPYAAQRDSVRAILAVLEKRRP